MVDEDNRGAQEQAPAPRALCAEHPQRAAVGTCARCGSYYCAACAGRRDGAAHFCRRCDEGRAYVPWEDPALGFFASYAGTLASSLVAMPKFAAELPRRGGWAKPLSFALLPTLVSALLGAASVALFAALMGDGLFPEDPQQTFGVGVFGAIAVLTYVVGSVGGYAFYLVAWPGVLLLVARMFGNRRLEYEGLYRILCYASGFNFLYFFPVLGLLVFVYHLVLSVACIAAQGRISTLTALGIAGLPAVAFGGCCCGGYFALLLLGMR